MPRFTGDKSTGVSPADIWEWMTKRPKEGEENFYDAATYPSVDDAIAARRHVTSPVDIPQSDLLQAARSLAEPKLGMGDVKKADQDFDLFLRELQTKEVPAAVPVAASAAPRRAPARAIPSPAVGDMRESEAPDQSQLVREAIMQRVRHDAGSMRDARKASAGLGLNAGLGEAFDTIAHAGSKKQSDPTFYRNLAARSNEPVQQVVDQRDAENRARTNLASEQKLQRDSDLMDPNSRQSKVLQDTIARLYPNRFSKEQLAKVTVADKDLIFEPLKLAEQMQMRREVADLRRQQGEITKLSVGDRFIETQTQKHAANMEKSGLPEAISTIQEIEGELGMPIEAFDGDVPGYGRLEGLIPDFMTGDRAGKLRQLVQKLANVTLKKRSGAAVTNQEMTRFKREFGTGTFVPDSRLLNALASYKQALRGEMSNWDAGVTPEAKERYQARGGLSAKDISKPVKTSGQPSFNIDQDEIEAEMRRRGLK